MKEVAEHHMHGMKKLTSNCVNGLERVRVAQVSRIIHDDYVDDESDAVQRRRDRPVARWVVGYAEACQHQSGVYAHNIHNTVSGH